MATPTLTDSYLKSLKLREKFYKIPCRCYRRKRVDNQAEDGMIDSIPYMIYYNSRHKGKNNAHVGN